MSRAPVENRTRGGSGSWGDIGQTHKRMEVVDDGHTAQVEEILAEAYIAGPIALPGLKVAKVEKTAK